MEELNDIERKRLETTLEYVESLINKGVQVKDRDEIVQLSEEFNLSFSPTGCKNCWVDQLFVIRAAVKRKLNPVRYRMADRFNEGVKINGLLVNDGTLTAEVIDFIFDRKLNYLLTEIGKDSKKKIRNEVKKKS